MQPKKYQNPRIALLNIELELKSEKENAEIRIDNVEVMYTVKLSQQNFIIFQQFFGHILGQNIAKFLIFTDQLFHFCVDDLLQEYQSIVDAEWSILYEKLEKIVASGAKVVLSKLPIGDVATQYFADRFRNKLK